MLTTRSAVENPMRLPFALFLSASFLVASGSAQIVSVRGSGRVDNDSSKPSNPTAPGTIGTPETLANRDVVDMVAMGLPDDIVAQRIQTAAATKFDLTVAGLRTLKAAKVSDAVIRVMLNPKASAVAVAVTPVKEQSGLPQSVGVYFLRKGEYVEIEPEVVGWKSGGVLKQTATLGLDKQHINGKVMGPHSSTRLTNPLEIVIRTMEGTSATEYQLLSLYQKVNRREFRSVTGGVLHMAGDAERTRLAIKPEKIADRTWRIRLDRLSPGEYGLLPPGVSSASIGASGKIFSFAIVE
jgi:hypothetical protein